MVRVLQTYVCNSLFDCSSPVACSRRSSVTTFESGRFAGVHRFERYRSRREFLDVNQRRPPFRWQSFRVPPITPVMRVINSLTRPKSTITRANNRLLRTGRIGLHHGLVSVSTPPLEGAQTVIVTPETGPRRRGDRPNPCSYQWTSTAPGRSHSSDVCSAPSRWCTAATPPKSKRTTQPHQKGESARTSGRPATTATRRTRLNSDSDR